MKTVNQTIKATPGQAIRMLEDYNTCVFGLMETIRLALKHNLVDKFFKVEDL